MGVQDYLYSEFDPEIIEEFLMLWDMIEDNIDLLVDALYTDKEVINDIFRIFHNLKSASAFLKLKRIQTFAHFVEGILEYYRDHHEMDRELIDWLFKVSEQLHTWYSDINENKELSPINPEVLKIPKKVLGK
ncbi:MAG: hypothetical protein GXO62_00545 [Epsilonproteobacteria bacterium]|nr:hypothetical protein [Campylobacterota bacterium]